MYKEMIMEAQKGGLTSEKTMWASVANIEEVLTVVKEKMPEIYWAFIHKEHGNLNGGHYNEAMAKWDVSQMYYEGSDGGKHKAPYWTDEEIATVWEKVKPMIKVKAYNMWDFYVVMNMMKADNYNLLRKWWPQSTTEEMNGKLVDMAINYLNDDDARHKETKIWDYLHG